MAEKIKYHTKAEAIQAVTEEGNELIFCAPELQNNEEVVMAAVKKNEEAFKYASDELKSNETFVLKAIHEGVATGFVFYSTKKIKSNIEVLTLLLEKSDEGWEFSYARGEVALNKKLAAKALIKWGKKWGASDLDLWNKINPTLQEFFPKDSWLEKAQAYLLNLEKIKQEAENASGGSSTQDEVVW